MKTEHDRDAGRRVEASKRATHGQAYTILVIAVVAIAVAAAALTAASGLFGNIMHDPTAERLPGRAHVAKEAPAGQRR